jgi:hypothetical protein
MTLRHRREEADADAFDERGLLRDGKSVRVPLTLRDSDSFSPVQRAVALAGADRHRPGFRDAAAAATRTADAIDAAYDEYEETLTTAWQTDARSRTSHYDSETKIEEDSASLDAKDPLGHGSEGRGGAGSRERERHTSRGNNRPSLKKYASHPAVREAVMRYNNNRASQREVKEALKKAGASEKEVSGINWSKSYFSQREFEDEYQDHRPTMDEIYAAHDEQLSQAWRQGQ